MAFVTDIQFTREVEENGKLPFLVCLVSHDNTELPAILSHRSSTIETYPFISMQYDRQLIRRELTSTLTVFFSKNNYNEEFIQRNTHRPTTITEANDNATPTTTATIPYTNLLPHYGSY